MTLLQRLVDRLKGNAHGVHGNGHHRNGHHSNGHGALPDGNGHAHPAARPPATLPAPAAPRVLILSVSAGTGHVRAAEAIELALHQLVPDAHVRNVDILALSTPPFRRCYGKMYVEFIDLAPQVLGFFYNLMDRPNPGGPGLSGWDRLRIFLEKSNLRAFIHLLQSEPWDLVISTHFLAGEIIAALAREDRLHVPHIMVTTDFETHRLWVNQPCAHYFTATEEAALYLKTFGVPHRDATAVGIPIHPVFSQPKDRSECLARQGLVGDRPIVLQLSGGYGVGPIHDLYKALLDVETPIEIVVVTAHNAKAKKQLEATPVPPRHRAKILGFTKQIDELMRVADLIVTKPGGLTTSEILAVGGAMVIVDPVPGQEERNSDYLLENGAAIKVNHLPTMPHKLDTLLRDPERLARVRANARRLGRPRAAFEIVERSLEVMQRSGVRHRHALSGRGDGRIRCELPARPPAQPLNPFRRLARAWRASRTWLDLFELQAMHLFARLWHRCTSNPSPVPTTGPAIVVANHPSHADPAFLMATALRPLCFLHARENYDAPLLRHVFQRAGCIPVGRKGRDVGAVRQALRCLAEGKAVCVFPEGDVRPDGADGTDGPARNGAAFLALKTRAPVYPALIAGGPRRRSVVRDWLLPSRGVQVLYGPPVDLSAYYGRPIDHKLLVEVTARIMQSIRDLKPGP